MGRKITSRDFMSMTITLFMFVIGNYPNVYATIDSSLSIDSPKDITLALPLPLPLPLPLNSHMNDALNNNLGNTNNLIPFP
jgi:hypothetical protein